MQPTKCETCGELLAEDGFCDICNYDDYYEFFEDKWGYADSFLW